MLARRPDAVVVGADTIVTLEGDLLGKPVDELDAIGMLTRLSGRAHQVMTGVAVAGAAGTQSDVEVSHVWFHPLDAATIEQYVATGEPLDKAGAYAIQGRGGALVERTEGEFDNIVGLPMALVERLLSGDGDRALNEADVHRYVERLVSVTFVAFVGTQLRRDVDAQELWEVGPHAADAVLRGRRPSGGCGWR